MKIIEGLKKIQSLQKKAEDLRDKMGVYCAHLNIETPTYPDQKGQVKEWMQAHGDILKEILGLRVAIQTTNLATEVIIEIGGKAVKHNIAEWIHIRRDLAGLQEKALRKLTDKNLKEGFTENTQGEKIEIRIVRCYDPQDKDKNIDIFSNEPSLIDAKLEVTNAVTDLLE